MELTQKKVYQDIEEIKNTIECSKRKLSGPYKLFFVYGILQGLMLILNLLGIFIWHGNGITAYSNFVVDIIVAIVMTGIFVKIYRNEKNTSNKYYLSVISIWGMIVVAMPFLLFAARLVIIISRVNIGIESLSDLTNYKMIVNMLLACAATISVAYLTDKNWMVALAIIIMFVYILANLFSQVLFYVPVKNIQIQVNIAEIFYYVINIFGYIGLGFLLLRQEKKSGNSKYTRGV